MTHRPDPDRRSAQQARLAAIVIAATMLVWMGAQWFGAQLGWAGHTVFLFDFAALAAFGWALVMTYRIWRARRNN